MPFAKPRSSSSIMNPEQKVCKSTKEAHAPFDNIIRQAMAKDPFVSFSRAGENHLQWIQLLHALDQQGTNKLSKGSKPSNGVEGKDWTQEVCNGISFLSSETNGFKDSVYPKGTGSSVKGTKLPVEHVHYKKIPDIVALAAAKGNNESEKYFPGWPLSLPLKVQMQKCDKCSQEFCSPINYRRHIRIHRRSLNIDKDSSENREYLGSFWDKLSLEEATEIMSFKNVVLEEVPGSSIIKTLTSFVQKPGFISLPQFYIKAGAAILDIIHSRPSVLPISSKELFDILDDASEQTFLCAGTAASMKRFIFDGEAAKTGLESRNIVACTSFLIEQKLVAAWLADKDAEALRCQKLLVEEEEAAQKRQAELSEKRRMKKLRHKEQKLRGPGDDDTTNDKDVVLNPVSDSSTPVETAASPVPVVVEQDCSDLSYESVCPLKPAMADADGKNNRVNNAYITDPEESEMVQLNDQNVDPSGSRDTDQKAINAFGKRHFNMHGHQTVRQSLYLPNGFTSGLGAPSKSVANQKFGGFKDQKMAPQHKVWTRKSTMEKKAENAVDKARREIHEQSEENKKCEVLIGSISVSISEYKGTGEDGVDTAVAVEAHSQECNDSNQLVLQPSSEQQATNRNPILEKRGNPDFGQTCTNQSKVKLWRPVGVAASDRKEGRGSIVDRTDGSSCDRRKGSTDAVVDNISNRSAATESCHRLPEIEREAFDTCRSSLGESAEADAVNHIGLMLFSSHEAEMFLNQRWKKAISDYHVTVVISPDNLVSLASVHPRIASAEPTLSVGPGNPESVERIEDFNHEGRTVLASTENRMAGADDHRCLNGALKLRSQTNTIVKTNRLKYIPKQKSNVHQ